MCRSLDEQFSTWMAWILSSKCLAHPCISTQSSHLNLVGGRDINSPRQPSGRWQTAIENSPSDEPMDQFSHRQFI
jgi:hypothetical protein